jgi:hypothetical protein
VHVHIYGLEGHREKEHGGREAPAWQQVAVDLYERVLQHAVANRAPVDEQMDPGERRPVTIRARHEAGQGRPALLVRHGYECLGLALAEHGGDAIERVLCGGPHQGGTRLALYVEVHAGTCQSRTAQPVRDVAPLRRCGLEELAARRHRGEQVGHLDTRAGRSAGRARLQHLTGTHQDLEGLGCLCGPRAQSQRRDRCDRGQRLSAEAVARNVLQIPDRPDLAGGVALDREPGVVGRHAAAIVAYGDPLAPPVAHLDPHATRPRVEGILHELLHHRGRSLDHLAGSDLVDERIGQPVHPSPGPGRIRRHLSPRRALYHACTPSVNRTQRTWGGGSRSGSPANPLTATLNRQ